MGPTCGVSTLIQHDIHVFCEACLIAENMGRLVSAVADLRPFAPSLLPQLKRISEEVAVQGSASQLWYQENITHAARKRLRTYPKFFLGALD